jgi:hypothetical protein
MLPAALEEATEAAKSCFSLAGEGEAAELPRGASTLLQQAVMQALSMSQAARQGQEEDEEEEDEEEACVFSLEEC